MAKRPDARFPSATAMRAALEDARSAPRRRRDRVRRAAGGLAMATALVTAAIVSARWARVHEPALEASNLATTSLSPAPPSTPDAPIDRGPARAGATTAPAGSPASATLGMSATTPTSASSPVPSLRDARAAAHAHPASPRALEAWTRAAFKAGDLHDAHRAATAWALHDGTVEPRLAMADILDASGRRPEAVAVLTEWLETHPDAADARAALSHLSGDAIARR